MGDESDALGGRHDGEAVAVLVRARHHGIDRGEHRLRRAGGREIGAEGAPSLLDAPGRPLHRSLGQELHGEERAAPLDEILEIGGVDDRGGKSFRAFHRLLPRSGPARGLVRDRPSPRTRRRRSGGRRRPVPPAPHRPGEPRPVTVSENHPAFTSVNGFHSAGRSSSGKIAVTGQTGTQASQSTHSSGWM